MLTFKKSKPMIKKSDIARQYASRPSFSDHLPWLEWSDDKEMVLLEDGRSVGAAFEVKAVATEARPESMVAKLHQKLVRMLSIIVPLEDENPWVMQIFYQNDTTLMPIYRALEGYVDKQGDLKDPLTQKYLEIMKEHFNLMCQDQGIFNDPMSGLQFKGKVTRIRIGIYRRFDKTPKGFKKEDAVTELDSVCQRFMAQIRQSDIKIMRLKGEHFYEWLVRWFNPDPGKTQGNLDQLLEKHPYPRGRKPCGWSLSENTFFAEDGGVSDWEHGWEFDGMKHQVVTFKELDSTPNIGALSRETSFSESSKYAALDKFPEGAIYTIQVTFESNNAIKAQLDMIEGAAIGKSGVVKDIHANVADARYEMDKSNNLLFRSVEAIYLRGKSSQALRTQINDLKPVLSDIGLDIIDISGEVFPNDLYLRFLPFNFNHAFDKHRHFRSAYKYADDVARLLPFYGRSQGDGHNFLNIYYNRGGEIFVFDELARDFKMANSHMAIVGTTGAGKSVALNNMILAHSAVRNPRIVAMEVGGSFDLTAKYLAHHGRDIKVMKFDRKTPMAVNPYAESYKALETIELEEAVVRGSAKKFDAVIHEPGVEEDVFEKRSHKIQQTIKALGKRASQEEQKCEEDRDILSEMLLATQLMITHGRASEALDPTDFSLITRSLVHAMKRCKHNNVPQMILSHVIESMEILADEQSNAELQGRLKQFALRLEYYTTGIRGQFVNRPSEPLEDFDFLHIDFGFMQSKSYKDLMDIVCISLLAKVLALSDANKSTKRPTELYMDEAHVLFKSDMVAAFVILMAKVARKIGLWLRPCTQNINDFTGLEAKKLLSMMETWICLSLEKDEMLLIDDFKPLTDEMKSLILDVRKYPGIYSEGVLIGKRYSGLFRNIPPRIALSLAMTEQDERARREAIKREFGFGDLDAVEHMAKEITAAEYINNDDKYFTY